MLSEKIEAQDFAVRLLKAHIENNRLSHTYLLTGEKGSGKEDLALAFAYALNCEAKNYFRDCSCNACRKAEAGNHPDLHVLGEDLKIKTLKIADVRNVIGDAALKPYEGRRKVFVLLEADRLSQDASNAFLKTLEEPPPHTVFILTVETKAGLLETIQSRSFEVRLKPLNADTPEVDEIAAEIRGKRWEDYFEELGKQPKDELKGTFASLMEFIRRRMNSPLIEDTYPYVRALEYLLDAQAALDDNANQKLLLSRLAMGFKKTGIPSS